MKDNKMTVSFSISCGSYNKYPTDILFRYSWFSHDVIKIKKMLSIRPTKLFLTW